MGLRFCCCCFYCLNFSLSCFYKDVFFFGFSYLESYLYDRCDHENSTSADACIKDIIGQNNSEHFFVASQDVDLRKSLQEVSLFCFLFDAVACLMF